MKADAALDITDVYVFESAPGKTTIIVCWAGFNDSRMQPDKAPLFDAKALYTVHIDTDKDNVADQKIHWRYGANAQDQFGVQWEGIPGMDEKVVGPVETILDASATVRLWTGHADDPFFFDAGGYLMTLATGEIKMTKDNDFLAGLNVTAAAIEIDTDLLAAGSDQIQVWATASTNKK